MNDMPKPFETEHGLYVDGERGLGELKGKYYADSMRGAMNALHHASVDFVVHGSPVKSVRSIKGQGFEVFDPYKAWLIDESIPFDEAYNEISEFRIMLNEDFRPTAAKSFSRMSGRIPWIDKRIEPYARKAYFGGIQWSRPGVYLDTVTSDMHEAYYWAMHTKPLHASWHIVYGRDASWNEMSLISATIKTNGKNNVPILPRSMGGQNTDFVYGGKKRVVRGYWFAPDIIAALPYTDRMEIHWVANASQTDILSERTQLWSLPKPLRKRLTLVGYGIHAQGLITFNGYYGSEYYEACKAFGTSRIGRAMYRADDGMSVWWKGEQVERQYARIDWAALVTARVRRRITDEATRIMENGGKVVRIYVDSITATQPAPSGYSDRAGCFKIESEGPAVIGPPGICLIAGDLKHSGVPIEIAQDVITKVRRGTYSSRDNNWTGNLEQLD